MKALIERRLYQPAIVLPMLMLVGLMTALDFSLVQIALVLAFRGWRYVFKRVARREAEIEAQVTVSHGKPELKPVPPVSLAKPTLNTQVVSIRSKSERHCHC